MLFARTLFARTVAAALLAVGFVTATASAHVTTRVALLMGAQETPPNASTGVGCAVFVIDTAANTATFRIVVSGLGTAETAAHIHGVAAPGVAAGVVFPLPAGPVKVGTWIYPEALESALLTGGLYVNVHSVGFPGGEVRGQIVTHVAVLDGAQEVPPNASPGVGFGLFNQDVDANTLSYYIVFGGLGAAETAAHIHGLGNYGVAAGVMFPLPAGSPKVGGVVYPEAIEQDVIDGRLYVNIHSVAFGGGEIRGQMIHYVNPIDGMQEVPVNASPTTGYALIEIDRAAASLGFDINRSALGTAETAAHFHGFAGPGVAAGVLFGLPAGVRKLGTWPFGLAAEPSVLGGLTYANIHTVAFAGGEIRGQLNFGQLYCKSDWNKDGAITPADVASFVTDWFASLVGGTTAGDYNGDGVVTPADVASFVGDWFTALTGGLC